MKFVACKDQFFAGFQHDIVEAGHHLYWWEDDKPTFDIFDEVEPDVIMITEITPSILKCLNDNIVVILWNEQTRLLTVGATQLQVPPMVDTHAFQLTEPSPDFECELARVGQVDTVLRDLCYPVGQFKIKIFGDDSGGGYGIAQHLGLINHQDECTLYASALLTYVDDVESALKVLACGGCPVSVDKELEYFAEIAKERELDQQHGCSNGLSNLLDDWSINPQLRNSNAQFIRQQAFDHPENTYQYLTVLLLEHINDIRDNQK